MPPSCALLGGFAIVHGLRCYGNTRNAWQSPAVIRQAHRTPHALCHALRMPAKTPIASANIEAPAACAVPFRPYCGGVVTRTRNVSEYMLVLAVCLVYVCNAANAVEIGRRALRRTELSSRKKLNGYVLINHARRIHPQCSRSCLA